MFTTDSTRIVEIIETEKTTGAIMKLICNGREFRIRITEQGLSDIKSKTQFLKSTKGKTTIYSFPH